MFAEDIPDDIFEIIFTFLNSEKNEQILQLISVNSYFHQKFLRFQRRVKIARPESVQRYLTYLLSQETLLSKISHPAKQVNLKIDDNELAALYRQREKIQIRSQLEVNHLEIKYPPLAHWILPAFKTIHSLTLTTYLNGSFDKSDLPKTLSSDIMQIIEQKYQSKEGFGLKILNLDHYNEMISLLPFFPELTSLSFRYAVQLTSLTLRPYQSLHSLELFKCPTMTDVSMLGNVFKLWICGCNNLEDVSNLTNNYSVSITSCLKVWDYRTGFGRNSSKITIIASHVISVNPRLFTKVKYLSLETYKHGIGKAITLPTSQHLRFLSMRGILFRFEHSYQHLRHVILDKYPYVQKKHSQKQNLSFHILGNIFHLELRGILGLRNLIGLGQEKQKVVELIDCVDIIDFTAIRAVPKVRIENCKGLKDCVQLDQVEHLILSKCSQFIGNVGNSKVLNHLEVYNCNEWELFPAMKELQIFELMPLSTETIKKVKDGNHRKILFHSVYRYELYKFPSFLTDRYTMQYIDEDRAVVYLRKEI